MNPGAGAAATLKRLQKLSLMVSGPSAVLLLLGAWIDSGHFFQAYLIGFIYWLAISLGSLGLLMVHYLTGGGWGFIIRRQLEAAALNLPLMGLLFLPLLLGMEWIFPWVQHSGIPEEILRHKEPYLNTTFFVLRAILYFSIWSAMALCLAKWSVQQDLRGEPDLTRRGKIISGPGIVIYALTATFASVDWIMSLEPEWFSTIYGLLFLVCHGLGSLALVIIMTHLLSDEKPLSELLKPKYFHDLGNLTLAFVMLWAYMSFSQFLIIWSANLPEEVSWYVHRTGESWQFLALLLILFHFALPLLMLLSRRSKRAGQNLVKIAFWILAVRFVDFFWWIKPAFTGADFSIHWMDMLAPIAVGGIWMAMFCRRLQKHALVPLHDPRLEEALQGKEVLNHG